MEESKFKVGDCVYKIEGYKYPGIVVSVFFTTKQKIRYVVECTGKDVEGMLHIFNEKQLDFLIESDKDLLGKSLLEETVFNYLKDKEVRYILEGSIITMDFKPERLNIVHNNNIIKKIYKG